MYYFNIIINNNQINYFKYFLFEFDINQLIIDLVIIIHFKILILRYFGLGEIIQTKLNFQV